MDFGSPSWLNALYAAPLLLVIFIYGARRRSRELSQFTGNQFGDSLAPGRSWRKGLLKASLKLMGYALVVLALARPQFGSQLVKVEREGIDLVIALDTSLSMLAEDMKPNRLERAKQEIIDFIEGLRGDRVGLVAFAGDAFVLCPLTVDYSAALMFAQTADFDMVSTPGSALGEAISKSAALFNESTRNDRVIILVTDGEAHEGEVVEVAREVGERGIRIYTIGIGNPDGELIPLRGTDGSVSGYKKDRSGQTVLTRLDEKTLREISDVSGGKYLPATRQGLELQVLYREISGLERRAIEGEFMERKTERFPWFLAAAFLLLGIEVVTTRKGPSKERKTRRLHTGVAGALMALLWLGLPGVSNAKSVDAGRVKSGNQYFDAGEYEKALALYREAMGDSMQLPKHAEGVLYNEANTLYMMGRYEPALAKYRHNLWADSLDIGQTLYNRANTLVQMKKPQEAVESYLQALRYLPDDLDVRHNLELALRMLEQQQQQQQQNDSQEKKEQDPDDQQQKQDQDSKDPQNQQGDDSNPEDQDQQQENPDPQESQQPDSSQTQQAKPDSSQASQVQSIQLTKEDALRILKLLEEQEKELQKAKRKAAFKRLRSKGKDW